MDNKLRRSEEERNLLRALRRDPLHRWAVINTDSYIPPVRASVRTRAKDHAPQRAVTPTPVQLGEYTAEKL